MKQIEAPFERKNSRFALQFESYAMLILTYMPIKRAAKILRCDDKSLTSILWYWVNDAVKKRQLDAVKTIAIDETSFKKGHKYVTVVIDSAKRAVIDGELGKDKSAATNFARKLSEKSGDKNNITSVTCDTSNTNPSLKYWVLYGNPVLIAASNLLGVHTVRCRHYRFARSA